MGFEIRVRYGAAPFALQAEIEVETSRRMLIRVYGKHHSILFENNYPLVKNSKGKKSIQWNLLQGGITSADRKKDAALMQSILSALEIHLKDRDGIPGTTSPLYNDDVKQTSLF